MDIERLFYHKRKGKGERRETMLVGGAIAWKRIAWCREVYGH
jgi:hypothetical protein